MFASFLASAIGMSAIFLCGCVGEILTEKSGHLNLGIPGIMCAGTAGGGVGVYLYTSALADPTKANFFVLLLLSILFCLLFAAIAGLIYAFLTVSLRSNQNITGLALTTFGVGVTQFIMNNIDKSSFSSASRIISQSLPFADKLGWFGEIFLSQSILVYLAIIIAIAAAFILRKTRVGLNLRAVGENPAAADAVGINVTKYKYLAILIGSAIAGLGGLCYIMDYLKGGFDSASTIESFGWLSIALVIFTLWKPDLSIIGSILFGALYIAPYKITGISFEQMKLFNLLPYLITIIVLIITSVMDSKENQPPAALGLSYFREER